MQFVRAISTTALSLLFAIVPAYAQPDKQSEKQGKPDKQQGSQQQQHSQGQPHQSQASGQQHQQQPQDKQHGQAAQQPQQQHAQQTNPQSQQQHAQQTPQKPPQQQTHQQQQQQRVEQPHQQQPQQQHAQYTHQQSPQRTQQQAVAWQQQRGWQQQGSWQGHSTWQQGRTQQWDRDHRTWAQRGGYGGYYIPQDRYSIYFGSQHYFRMHNRPTFYMGYPRFSYGGFSFLLVDPWPGYWGEDWYDTDDVYIGYNDGYYLYNRRYPNVGLAITVVL